MGYIASENSEGEREFVPCPDGEQNAVCVDVVDLGNVPGYQGRTEHKCRLVFEVEEKTEDGINFTVGQRFSVSLHEKSNLRPFLEKWRGRKFTKEEAKAFDLETLINVSARISVSHNESVRNGKTYANVDSAIPAKKGSAFRGSGNYVRVKDREDYEPPVDSPWNVEAPVTKEDDKQDDIPF